MKSENARNKSRPARPRCSFQWQPQSVGLSRRVPPPVQVQRGESAQREPPQMPCPATQKPNTYSVMSMHERGVVRARDEEASPDEPPALRARVAGLPVSVDRSDFAYHGLDGEDFERLQLYAVSTAESPPNDAWASELVTESVVSIAVRARSCR